MENILVRLSAKERDELKLLVAALKVSEYTDDVDSVRSYEREEKMRTATTELFGIMTGLSFIARDLTEESKKQLEINPGNPKSCEPLFASLFEVGRRFKQMNPDKIRSEYGKLVMLLQDLRTSRIKTELGLGSDLVRPLKTVGSLLARIGCQDLLRDARLKVACTPLTPSQLKDGTSEKQKDTARQGLVAEYAAGCDEKAEIIERCIHSIDDAECFRSISTAPIRRLQHYLKTYFAKPDSPTCNLEVRAGRSGACFSHSHAQQYGYVMESLTLWGIIHKNIHLFWQAAEDDLIGDSASTYRFMNTGQGYHRVSSAPNTASLMRRALSEARTVMGDWVGSTIVHLGDRDVPNALVFIDKYTVIPKLLGPIVHAIEGLDVLAVAEPSPGIRNFLKAKYGSIEELKLTILSDFFRHGFDGSGDDGGSCIDGRLTSAWNWCSLLHKKTFYDAFLLTGFTGFDDIS